MAASPSPSPSVAPSPAFDGRPISPSEAKKLIREFTRAQNTELKALEHRQSVELSELKASQRVRRREWNHEETLKRENYFATHPTGPEKRAYIHDYSDRFYTLNSLLKDELSQRIQEQQVHMKSLKDEQARELKEFQESLQAGKRPPAALWPK